MNAWRNPRTNDWHDYDAPHFEVNLPPLARPRYLYAADGSILIAVKPEPIGFARAITP